MLLSPSTFPVLARACFARVLRSFFLVLLGAGVWLAGMLISSTAAALEPPARAAETQDIPAPMCDPMGASVAAQPDMDLPVLDRGRFEELSCDALALLLSASVRGTARADHAVLGERDRPEPPPREMQRVRYDGTRALVTRFPLRIDAVLLAEAPSVGLSPRRGHRRSVYRPPV
jgi:hypothetical protein